MYKMIVHGGAGAWKRERAPALLAGVRQAAEAGVALLSHGDSALDAVTAAVTVMEDDPLFNAGTGSVLNIDGTVEMDASIMVGQGLHTGNVACLCRVRNPVLVARKVMEETGHVLLAGEGAMRFARAAGFADYDPVTPQRLREWRDKRAALLQGERSRTARLREILHKYPELVMDTVGAVARDMQGGVATATSTGGMVLKLSGRVGDTPLPGAGSYATALAGACATGLGELVMRFLTAKAVCDQIAAGRIAQQAVNDVLTQMTAELGKGVGIIALDSGGNIGVGHTTPAMPHAFAGQNQRDVVVRMHAHLAG